ncbi:MAG: flagellar hook-associated protein FlgK, partial [Calditrichia bacterium]
SRLGMDITSHNIANVNTPGFSRQRVENKAAYPMQLPQGQLGLGVRSEQIVRVRDGLLDAQYRQTSFSLGNATVKENLYTQLESIMQEPDETGIGNLMTDFFSEFSNLAADPENTAIRSTLRQKAISLVDAFHRKDEQLASMQESIRNDTLSAVDQVNQLTGQIADLNRQITTAEISTGKANDLRDQRDLLLDKLSEYVKITYTEDQRGQLTVNTEGMNLVSGVEAKAISAKTINDGVQIRLQLMDSNGKTADVQYGRLGGMLEMYNKTIPGMLDKLDTLSSNLVTEVNRLHSAGQRLPVGDPPTPSAGIDFFTGTDAGTINISREIMDDVSNIASSVDGTPGNGEVAIAISNIRNQKMFNGGSQTLDDFYTGAINSLGIEIQKSQNTRQSQELLQQQISNQRDAASGVSLDEEMTNLIKYQRSFEAAAKVVGAVDEMMQTIINMV